MADNEFINRLQTEHAELGIKIDKLVSFIDSPAFEKIASVQQALLKIQYQSMLTYKMCILERLRLL